MAARNDITTLALYGHGSENPILFNGARESDSLSHHYIVLYAFSLRYFATKFDLLMFSNIFDIISTFTVELKCIFVVLTVQQQQNGRLC